MRKRDYIIMTVILLVAFIMTPVGKGIIAQSSQSISGWLGDVTDRTNKSLQISIVSTDANQTIGGNLAVTGTSTLTGDVTAGDDLTVDGWYKEPPTIISAAAYTISSTGKAGTYISEYSDTGAYAIWLPTTPGDGATITIVDGDLNASSNNGTIRPYGGSGDTIQETTSFTQDANGESTVLRYSLTNTDWTVVGGYLE
jgi:hypothetical protein